MADTETITVSIPMNEDGHVIAAPVRESRRWDGTCKDCGDALDDKRKSRCDSCKAVYEANHQAGETKRKSATKGRTSRASVEGKLNGVTANILGVVTLMLAWSQLRRIHVADPAGNIASEMAFTMEEADAVARPLTRLFMRTEPGRRIAPVIVDNEDVVTAIFALWDWYKRNTDLLTNYRQANPEYRAMSPSPRNRTNGRNNHAEPIGESQASERTSAERFDADYIPPGIGDVEY